MWTSGAGVNALNCEETNIGRENNGDLQVVWVNDW